MTKPCKDCEPGSKRPAPHPGPRCATHHRTEKARKSDLSRNRRVRSQYGLSDEEQAALLEIQGGACAGCGKVPGRRAKRLAIDHDHRCCSGKSSCGRCVRGMLCHRCNDVLAHFRDDGDALRRLAEYLDNWPSNAIPDSIRNRAESDGPLH